jgi:hypothetical protein
MDDTEKVCTWLGVAAGFVGALYISAGWDIADRAGLLVAYLFGGAFPCGLAGLIVATVIEALRKRFT